MLLSSFCSSLGRCCWFSGARSGSFVATIIVAASSEATIWREKAILETVGQPKEESKKEEERERESHLLDVVLDVANYKQQFRGTSRRLQEQLNF